MMTKAAMPLSLQMNAISLESLGVNEFAWKAQYAFDLVDFCQNNQIGILGGDVLEVTENAGINYTFDNWHIEQGHDSWLNYVSLSCKYARERIIFYTERLPNKNLLFVLVMSREQKEAINQ